jgi:hypothetical protein
MNQPRTGLISLRRIVITICVLLGLAHVILLGWTLQRQSASTQLNEDRLILEENLGQLQQINQSQLDDLQADLDAILADIAVLEASFPELDSSYAIYEQGYDLAQNNQLTLEEINLLGSDIVDTISGQLVKKDYTLETRGSLENCLSFIDSLEQAGLDTISLDQVYIIPGENYCYLEISTLGYPSQTD